jgi:uncharacterized protein
LSYPTDIGVIDLMIGFPFRDKKATYDYLMPGIKDAQSRAEFAMPAQYMFKDIPGEAGDADPIETTFSQMDRYGIDIGLFGLSEVSIEARRRHPGRVAFVTEVDPNDVMGTVRRIKRAKEEHDLKAVSVFPSGLLPQVAVDDKKMYPVYATCVECDIPLIANAGIAGPRLPSMVQHVELFDEVCYDFPELRLVMRHGAEPWTALAVKLMLKWPGLHYMPSAFAPKHYPADIVHFANTRGADKIMYAGYYPAGLTLERIFRELPHVPFKEEVWPKFLRDNARCVFKL